MNYGSNYTLQSLLFYALNGTHQLNFNAFTVPINQSVQYPAPIISSITTIPSQFSILDGPLHLSISGAVLGNQAFLFSNDLLLTCGNETISPLNASYAKWIDTSIEVIFNQFMTTPISNMNWKFFIKDMNSNK